MLEIWTAQYRYSGKDRVDVTVKSSTYPWNLFAPTWTMVMDYKRTGDEQDYVKKYNDIVKEVYIKQEQGLLTLLNSNRTITLICFCPAGAFCHRVLLAQHLASLGAIYHGERR